jgi:hypothetical protein
LSILDCKFKFPVEAVPEDFKMVCLGLRPQKKSTVISIEEGGWDSEPKKRALNGIVLYSFVDEKTEGLFFV